MINGILSKRIARLNVSLGPCRSSARLFSLSPPLSIDPKSIYVLCLPITTHRSFIYCNHRPGLLTKSRASKLSWINKVETKIIHYATNGWNKMTASKSKINVSIVKYVKKLLWTIPYEESCLLSFPNKAAMIREINEESRHVVAKSPGEEETFTSEQPTIIAQSEIQDLKISTDQLVPIPLYHPLQQEPTTVLEELYRFRDANFEKHKKYSILCAVGIPLTLPVVLVPIVPNVPGIYLTYRLYCNVKALFSIKNMDYLLEKKQGDKDELLDAKAVHDTTHLRLEPVSQIDQIYSKHVSQDLLVQLNKSGEEEEVVISEPVIDDLAEKLALDNHVKEALMKALDQETKRLKREVKIGDQVE